MADDIDIEEHDVMNNSYVKGMFPDLALVKTEAGDHETSTGSPSVASDSLSLDKNLRALRHIHEKYANMDGDDPFNAQLLAANCKQRGVDETDNTTIVDMQPLTLEAGSNTLLASQSSSPDNTLLASQPSTPDNTLLASQPSTPDNNHVVSEPSTPKTGNPKPVTSNPSTSETGNTTLEATHPSTPSSEAIPDSTTDLDAQVLTRVADSPHIVSSTQEEEAASSDLTATSCIILGSTLTPQPPIPEVPNIDDDDNIDNEHCDDNIDNEHCDDDDNIDDIDYEHCVSAAVDLQDWGPFLENSKSYCKECQILFSTVNSYDAHKMQVHSFLVAVERELEREMTPEKPVESKRTKKDSKQNCVLCTQSFDNEDELIQHFYVHLNKALQCSKCDKTFNSKILLSEHKLTHDSEKSASKVLETSSRIRKPSIKLLESAASTRDSTPSESSKSSSTLQKATSQTIKMGYKCHCGCLFKQPQRLVEHHVYFHNEKPPSTFKTDPLDTTCEKCQKFFTTLQTYNKHILTVHLKIKRSSSYRLFLKAKSKLNRPIKNPLLLRKKPKETRASTEDEPKENPNNQEEKIVIPKSTLFKCSKCSVHFINSAIASSHFRNCYGIADNVYNCTKCNVKLKLSCEAAHEKQHRFGDYFSIHAVDAEDIRLRTLAQCPKCCVHYSEQSFWGHLENCDGKPSNKFSCNQCNINIDNNIEKTHEYGHKSLKFDADGFILIDYGEIGVDGTIDSTQNEHRGYLLYLCNNCKCFITFRKHKSSNCHYNATCKNLRKATCTVCGVVVSAGSLTRHLDYHKRIDSYTLDNFKFFSLVENKPIKPIPEYAYCKICEIRFHSNVFLSDHNCKKTEYKTCKICNLKFTDVAYKLHMPFHNLGGTQPTSKENNEISTSTLAFDITMNYCISCKCYFHKIRRHNDSQGRCNQKIEKASLCDTCGLLCGNNGVTHKQYHEKHGNFTLHDITFYRMPNRKRIKPPIPIYNPCKKCKIHFFTKRELREHQCGKVPSKMCEICDIKLSNKAHCLHMPFHSYRPNMSDEEDSETEDVPSDKYTANEEYEDLKETKVNVSIQEYANEVSEEENLEGEHKKVKKFVFYECRYCKFAIVLKGDCKSHRCKTSQPNKRFTCKKCGLLFSKVMMTKHNRAHDSDPTYIRENFQLIPFSPLDSGVKKVILYKCSKCDVCMMDYTIRDHFKRFCNDQKRDACKKCNLKFAHETTHIHLHRKHPVLNKDTVEVTVINSLQDYIDKINKNSNKVFQCRRCKTILFCRQSVEDHKRSCKKTEENLFFCKMCRLDIPDNEDSLKTHNEYHSQNPEFLRDNISVIQFCPPKFIPKPKRAAIITEKYTLYKCNRCKTCFMSPASVYRHGKSGHCGDSDPWKCEKCGFLIAGTNLAHKRRHIQCPDMTRENICVVVFEAGKVKHVETSDGAKHDKLETKKSDRKVLLYFCKQCDVHCMSPASVSEHRSRPHVYNRDTSACKLCGLKFSKFAMSYHIKVHHKQRGYKLDDFVIKEIQPFKKYNIEKAHNTVEQPATNGSDSDEKDEENQSDVMELPKRTVSRKRKHDGELVEATSVCIYQCICRLNFMSRIDIKEHLKNCNGINTKSGLKCSKCKLVFEANYLVRHSLKHHSSESDFKYNITEVNPFYSFLYRCGTCYTHFVNEASLGSHVKECSTGDIQGRKCTKCNLLIHNTMIEKHKAQHSKSPNLTNDINDTELITYNAPKNAEEGNAKNHKYSLYKCNVCNVHFIIEKQRDTHLKIAKSVHSPNNYLLCKTCNLIISKDDFKDHSKDHHGINGPETYVNKRDKFLDKNLYYCNECEIHLLRKCTFEQHHTTPGHGNCKKNSRKDCRICGLTFTGISLISHIRVHHDVMNLKLEDFNIIVHKPIEDVTDVSKKQKEQSNEYEEGTNDDESDSMSNNEPEVVNEKQNIDTEHTIDSNPNIKTIQEVGNRESKRQRDSKERDEERKTVSSKITEPKSQKIEDKIVYYRCKNCNVMFLNKKNCLEHLSPHSPMPEYDFMECKICNKNFEVDALKPHMVHHKNHLSYEAVRIVEYEAEDNTSDDTGHSDHSSNETEMDNNPTTSTKDSRPNYDMHRIKKNDKLNKSVEDSEANDNNTPDSEENSDEQSKSSKQAESDDENDSDNKFSCHLCSKKYKTDRARDIHVSLDHLDEEKQCPFCDRTFNLSILNDIHLCMSGDMFKCCICGNIFQQLLLESHAREGCLKE